MKRLLLLLALLVGSCAPVPAQSSVQINGFPAASPAGGSDIIAVWQSGGSVPHTRGETVDQVKTYVLTGLALTADLPLQGHVLKVAAAGDSIAWLGNSTLIGTDANGSPYLQNANGSLLGFDSSGNPQFGGQTFLNGTGLIGDGSQVTGLNASRISSGTLAIGLLPSGMNGTGLGESSPGVLSVNTTQNINRDTAFSSAGFVKSDASGNLTIDTNTYLTVSAASGTYLTQSAATSLYLSQSNAAATYVPLTRTINGHALSSSVVITASDISTGTLPLAQLPSGMAGTGLSYSLGVLSVNTTQNITRDSAFTSAGFVKSDASGNLTIDTGTYVTQSSGDNRYMPQAGITFSSPIATVSGGGQWVYQLSGTTYTYTGLGGYTGNAHGYTSRFWISTQYPTAITQSVKLFSLPFSPALVAWNDLKGGAQTSSTKTWGEIQTSNGATASGGNTSFPAGQNNGVSATRWTLTFGTAAITCSAGDTMVCCNAAAGAGGSQFTFTADATVTSSATVAIRAITSGGTTPTTGDTHIYNQTTGTDYTTTYSKNSATNSSIWPSVGCVFLSTNGSNVDVNFEGAPGFFYDLVFSCN